MRILSFRPGQAIVVELPSGPVTITLLDLRRGRHGVPEAKLGVLAPRSIKILRSELLEGRPHGEGEGSAKPA